MSFTPASWSSLAMSSRVAVPCPTVSSRGPGPGPGSSGSPLPRGRAGSAITGSEGLMAMAADSGRAPARSPDRHGAYLPAPVATGTPPIVERPAAPSGQIIRRPSEYDGELIPAGRCRMRLIACGTFSCPCPRPASWPGFDREPAHKPGLLLSASHGRRGARRFSLRRTLAHSGACCPPLHQPGDRHRERRPSRSCSHRSGQTARAAS